MLDMPQGALAGANRPFSFFCSKAFIGPTPCCI